MRLELTFLVGEDETEVVVIACLYATDGRVLGRGCSTDEDNARTEVALDMARREAEIDERITRELRPFRPRGACKARMMQDAERILGKVGK